MRKSRLKIEALIMSTMITVSLLMPIKSFGQGGRTDGFFSNGSDDYGNRDEGVAEVTGGITNDPMGAPLGSGLLIMTAAGAGYVLMKKRKRALIMLAAMVLMAGLTQCRKKVLKNHDNSVNITLDVGGDAKIEINTANGVVTFNDGDAILVANGGKYVGSLTYGEGVFSGSITDPTSDDYLHFYNLGNVEVTGLTEGVSTGCSVSIADQINSLPLISYGHSTEKYSSEITAYTARLQNKCALVKFSVSTLSTYAATCIKYMNNMVAVDFTDATFEYGMSNDGKIALAPGNGERWAILLPQDESEEGGEGDAFSGRYIGSRGYVPEIHADDLLDEGISVVMNTLTQPDGALNGEFTVDASGKKVVFSKSNLAYTKASREWKFRGNQYTTVERAGVSIGTNYSAYSTITLYEWGQTGYNHGAVSYIPNETSTNQQGFYAYGDPECNLYDRTGKADWGYVVISNGGGINKQWRTLKSEEWNYLFTERPNADEKYGRAMINNTYKGVIILPDDWVQPENTSFYAGDNVACEDNNYSYDDWNMMEAAGAVFLPYAGYRFNVGAFDANSCAYIWSSTAMAARYAYAVKINDTKYSFQQKYQRNAGISVRLVCE